MVLTNILNGFSYIFVFIYFSCFIETPTAISQNLSTAIPRATSFKANNRGGVDFYMGTRKIGEARPNKQGSFNVYHMGRYQGKVRGEVSTSRGNNAAQNRSNNNVESYLSNNRQSTTRSDNSARKVYELEYSQLRKSGGYIGPPLRPSNDIKEYMAERRTIERLRQIDSERRDAETAAWRSRNARK